MEAACAMTKKEVIAIVDHMLRELSTGDIETLVGHFVTGCVFHGPAGMKVMGQKTLFCCLANLKSAFPDLYIELKEIVVYRDIAAIRAVCGGTHLGSFVGVPPTNQRFSISVQAVMQFKERKVVEAWAEMDTLWLLQQLCIVPGFGAEYP
jgi:predicted ester cyclase